MKWQEIFERFASKHALKVFFKTFEALSYPHFQTTKSYPSYCMWNPWDGHHIFENNT